MFVRDIYIVEVILWSRSNANNSQLFVHSKLVDELWLKDVA